MQQTLSMMTFISDLVRRLAGAVLRLALGLSAAVFALSLLLATLVLVGFSLPWALLTGRKVAPSLVFGRYRSFSARRPGRGPTEVVDVEAREVRETPGRLPGDSAPR